jgi:topoisomerase-4 subunit A
VRKTFGPDTKLGKRRTHFADAPEMGDIDVEAALVEREPITVVISQKGWIRALKGHGADISTLQFKGDDGLLLALQTETTAKLLVFASNGKAYTLDGSKLPGGRGFGDPISLMVDMEEGAEVVTALVHEPGARALLAGYGARGFVAPLDELVANTRKGKNALNVDEGDRLVVAAKAAGDHVAIVGENRKLLVFPLAQLPEMARGKGVRLQRYRDGGVSDAKVFAMAGGLTWIDPAGRTFTVARAELKDWVGNRAEAGRLPPNGFPKSNKFAV